MAQDLTATLPEVQAGNRTLTEIVELSPDKFPILKYIHDGFMPDPENSAAFVAIQDNEIIGRIFLMAPTHMEGPWIRIDKRNGMLATRLVEEAAEKAKKCGVKKLFAYASTETIEGYLKRLGFEKVPMTVWAKEL